MLNAGSCGPAGYTLSDSTEYRLARESRLAQKYFAPVLMGHDTVSVLFVDNFSHTILISVLSSVMSRPDEFGRETSVRCTHEEMISTPAYPRPACNPLTAIRSAGEYPSRLK
jgi:hypothetical protein